MAHGVPLQVLVDKFSHARFEPSGMTKNREVRVAKSIVDYIFRWMATKFLSDEAQFHAGVNVRDDIAVHKEERQELSGETVQESIAPSEQLPVSSESQTAAKFAIQNDQDAPPCSTCGSIMIRTGACYKCMNCGATSGCA